MTRGPLIGIPTISADGGEMPALHAVRHTYIDAVVEAGGTPFLIPMLADAEDRLRELFDLCDGLLFCGGRDIAPELYREPRSDLTDKPDTQRDASEMLLMRWAIAQKKPVLGVCRGSQLMNVACGGTLVQDIPSMRKTATIHAEANAKELRQQLAVRHAVQVTAGSKLHAIVDSLEIATNTIHHQAADRIGENLRVVGLSSDGIVEAVEHTAHPFALGVQWHPELLWREDRVQFRIFEALVAAGRGTRALGGAHAA